MNVSIIKHHSPEIDYVNVVLHECSFLEFQRDTMRVTKEYLKKEKAASKMDIWWHLDEYYERVYGPCHWQDFGMDSITKEMASLDMLQARRLDGKEIK